MKKQDALNHFGGVVELAKALGCKPQAVSQWGETIPQGRAYQIEVLTGGKLKAEPITPTSDHNGNVTRPYVRIAPGTKPEDFPCVKGAAATKEQAEKE